MKALIPILVLLILVACEPRDKFGRTKAESEAFANHVADSLYQVFLDDSARNAEADAWMDSIKDTMQNPKGPKALY